VRWAEATGSGGTAVHDGVQRACAGLGHEPLQWRAALDSADALAALAAAVDPALPADEGLASLALAADGLESAAIEALLGRYRAVLEFVESRLTGLLAAHGELLAVRLPLGEPLAAARDELLARMAEGEAVAFEFEGLVSDLAAWRRAYAAAYVAHHAEMHGAERFAPYDRFRTGPLMRVLANLSRLALDVPDGATAVLAALRAERLKQCRRADLSVALRGALTCPECGLALGERVPLRAVSELEVEARRGIDELLARLRAGEPSAAVAAGLAAQPGHDARRAGLETLLRAKEPSLDDLLAASTFSVVDLANSFLTTRVVGRRSVGALAARLAGQKLAKSQAREAVERWLDPEGAIADDGLLEFED